MIQVAVLEHHQSVLNGYRFRLKKAADIEIVAALHYGEEVEPLVTENPVDMLILAVRVPTAPDNKTPYPILHLIPKLHQTFPDLAILVISMHKQAALTEAVLAAGASGYICKDDQAAIKNLDEIIRAIAEGGRYLSDEAKCKSKGGETILTPR